MDVPAPSGLRKEETAMDKKPLISVIVPVYKVEAYLGRCVESLLSQTYENLEIILVDDGSPDNCGQICDTYAARDTRIRVIHKENGGLSSARNAGIDVARGEYLGFVDSDDWVDVHTYEWLLNMALEENVKLVCAGRYDYYSWSGEKRVGLCPPKQEVIDGEELVKRIFLWDNVDSAAWDKLYHRSLFREIRYPLGVVSEDLPVTYRIALDAGRVGMLDRPVYYYFHREGSITTAAGVGLALGVGFYEGALVAGFSVLFILAVLQRWDRSMHKRTKFIEIYVEISSDINVGVFIHRLRGLNVEVKDIVLDRSSGIEEHTHILTATLKAPKRLDHNQFLEQIRQMEGVVYLEEL